MDTYELAELLHSKLCLLNHMDNCTWHYEIGDNYPVPTWEAWAHKKYFIKAQEILEDTELDPTTIAKVVRAL